MKPPGLSALAQRLHALNAQHQLVYLGTDAPDGLLAVEVPGGIRELPRQQMLDWLDGYTAALVGAPQLFEAARDAGRRLPVLARKSRARRERQAAIASVRAVLVNPTPTDQVRIMIRLAMQESGIGMMGLTTELGVTKKAIGEALRFRGTGTIGMLAVLGHDPRVRPDLAAADPDAPLTPHPPDGWAEPELLLGLRALGYAHEAGALLWQDPTDINRAMYARHFTVVIGATVEQVLVEELRWWVIGAMDAVHPGVAAELYRPPVPPTAKG